MSTTTSTTLTVCESLRVAAAIVDIIESLGIEVISTDWAKHSLSTPGHFGEGIGIMIGGRDESVIDSLEDVLHLKPEHPTDRTYGNYRRVGEWGGLVLSVTSGRSRPVCPCGSVCDHAAVTA